jgi:hypothetical protein
MFTFFDPDADNHAINPDPATCEMTRELPAAGTEAGMPAMHYPAVASTR